MWAGFGPLSNGIMIQESIDANAEVFLPLSTLFEGIEPMSIQFVSYVKQQSETGLMQTANLPFNATDSQSHNALTYLYHASTLVEAFLSIEFTPETGQKISQSLLEVFMHSRGSRDIYSSNPIAKSFIDLAIKIVIFNINDNYYRGFVFTDVHARLPPPPTEWAARAVFECAALSKTIETVECKDVVKCNTKIVAVLKELLAGAPRRPPFLFNYENDYIAVMMMLVYVITSLETLNSIILPYSREQHGAIQLVSGEVLILMHNWTLPSTLYNILGNNREGHAAVALSIFNVCVKIFEYERRIVAKLDQTYRENEDIASGNRDADMRSFVQEEGGPPRYDEGNADVDML